EAGGACADDEVVGGEGGVGHRGHCVAADRPGDTMVFIMNSRAEALVALLRLQPHPEGGHFREVFRSPAAVRPDDDRPARSALTTIDFLLARGECSAWHRVR